MAIMDPEEEIKQVFKIGLSGIVRDTQSLSMTGVLAVRRVVVRTAAVTSLGINHSRLVPEQLFQAPKTTTGQIGVAVAVCVTHAP
jgi:hypothetical protein